MSSQLHSKLTPVLLLLFAALALPASSQVAPAASSGGAMTFAAGAGFSGYKMYFGNAFEYGGTLWLDANFNARTPILHGLGIEMEARDISLNHPANYNDLRTDTLGGGLTYTVRRYRNFRPYAKFIASYGSLDLRKTSYHFTWVEYAPGGGVEYRPFKGPIWLRGDYEYQVWPSILGPKWDYDPQGFTVGAMYEFGHHSRQ
jgi:hypothetical protein